MLMKPIALCGNTVCLDFVIIVSFIKKPKEISRAVRFEFFTHHQMSYLK